jgi:hypothetical protein
MQGPRSVNAETGSAISQAPCLRPNFRDGLVQLQSRNPLALSFHQGLETFFSCWVNAQAPAELLRLQHNQVLLVLQAAGSIEREPKQLLTICRSKILTVIPNPKPRSGRY